MRVLGEPPTRSIYELSYVRIFESANAELIVLIWHFLYYNKASDEAIAKPPINTRRLGKIVLIEGVLTFFIKFLNIIYG